MTLESEHSVDAIASRRQDLLVHFGAYLDGIRLAREQSDFGTIDLFERRLQEVKKELNESFPRNDHVNLENGSV